MDCELRGLNLLVLCAEIERLLSDEQAESV